VESGRQITQHSITTSELDKLPVAQILEILQHHYTRRQELRHLLVMEIQVLKGCISHQEMRHPLELPTALPSDSMFRQEADKQMATV
jgi:ribosomal protein S13